MRRLTCLLITAAAVLACAPAAHAQTVTPPAACPGTFQVLHNDTIGTLSLKAGAYTITVQNPSVLSCATASSLLTRFLEDFDGVLPGSWVYDVATGAFVGSGGRAFTIAFTGGGGGGGGGGGLCPSTFQVLHDDSIGALSLPAGPYTITVKGLSCAAASTLFTRFLQDFDGVLPRPWRLNSQTGRFTRSRTVSFRVKRDDGPERRRGRELPERPALRRRAVQHRRDDDDRRAEDPRGRVPALRPARLVQRRGAGPRPDPEPRAAAVGVDPERPDRAVQPQRQGPVLHPAHHRLAGEITSSSTSSTASARGSTSRGRSNPENVPRPR